MTTETHSRWSLRALSKAPCKSIQLQTDACFTLNFKISLDFKASMGFTTQTLFNEVRINPALVWRIISRELGKQCFHVAQSRNFTAGRSPNNYHSHFSDTDTETPFIESWSSGHLFSNTVPVSWLGNSNVRKFIFGLSSVSHINHYIHTKSRFCCKRQQNSLTQEALVFGKPFVLKSCFSDMTCLTFQGAFQRDRRVGKSWTEPGWPRCV